MIIVFSVEKYGHIGRRESCMEIRINKNLQLLNMNVEVYQMYFYLNRQYTINHTHSHFELHYITEGSIAYTMNFHEEIVLDSNEWLLINKNVYHEETIPETCGGYVLAFDIPKELGKSHLDSFTVLPYYKSEKDSELGDLLNRILVETREQRLGFEDYRQNLFSQLFIHILRCLQGRETLKISENNQQENMYTTIDRFFNQVFAPNVNNITVQKLAAQLHVTPRHVNRILQKHYGVTFHEKLTEARIRYAAYLLESTDQSIAQISEANGLTQASLIANFKKIHGITPSRYRKLKKADTV